MSAFPPPTDLTIPDADSTTTRSLLSIYLRLQYRALVRLPFERWVSGDAPAQIRALLKTLATEQPGLLFSLIRRPTIGGMIRFLVANAGEADAVPSLRAWSSELLCMLAFELAHHGLVDEPIRVPRPPSKLLSLPQQTLLEIPSGTTELVFDGDGDAVPGERSSPYRELFGGIALALEDINPKRMVEAHPEKFGNAIDLGGHPVDEWVAALREAFDVVVIAVPAVAGEIRLLIQQIQPVGFHREKHYSASFQEVVGSIYMSLLPDPMTMAEALIHEFSHNKINVLWTLKPLLHNAFWPLYDSPVRPDPRPLHGVLLAVHAFLPVERMYERLAQMDHPLSKSHRFDYRWSQIRKLNHDGATTVLRHGEATEAGQGVLDEIGRWDTYFEAIGAATNSSHP